MAESSILAHKYNEEMFKIQNHVWLELYDRKKENNYIVSPAVLNGESAMVWTHQVILRISCKPGSEGFQIEQYEEPHTIIETVPIDKFDELITCLSALIPEKTCV